mgnify:CR=1 FL=1
MAPDSLTVLVAFTAGLLSFLSPCVLPLVPSYITFITGMGLDDVSRSRRAALTHAVLFVLYIYLAVWWQKRGDVKPKELPVSTYGRPLVKKA